MQQTTKTKKGAAAIYTVVFFCLLIGIVTLGFISIMLQDILGSTNYDLSQSAYDSALAGVEDAKVLLLKYNACLSNSERLGSGGSAGDCNDIISAVNTSGSSDDCDLVRDSLGRAHGEDGANETLIQSQNSNLNNNSKELTDSIDMAYTCVKMSLASDDYLGTLTKTSDVKLIPLRTGIGSAYNDAGGDGNFNRIRVEWYSNDDNRVLVDGLGSNLDDAYATTLPSAKVYTTSKTAMGGTDDNWHNFRTKATLAPPIRVSLIQADQTFYIGDFDGHNGNNTDRGTLILRPVRSEAASLYNHIPSNAGTGFTGSTISSSTNYTDGSNATNSPIDIDCRDSAYMSTHDELYACSAELDVPPTIRGTANNGARFLMLSSLYAEPDTSFSVKLLNCTSDDECKTVKFVGVQTKVDATGRANDLFRRVEARVELQDVSFPLAKYGLNVYGDGSDEGSIFKNYWATYNCWYKENGTDHTCDDYTRISGQGSFGD
ncbi:hypothetical protein IJ102_00535 [Candidatus Saccharibacteria bacterium]|nr:hypothetical protein [Candidatus Saccharibacteria bacterium]